MKPTRWVRGLGLVGLVWSVSGAAGADVAEAERVLRLPGYCEAGGGCDEHIARVQVGSIDNATDCAAPGGYGDYTALVADMTIGGGYVITVTNGHPYSSDQCKVWVDWNQDLDFYDAGEAFTLAGSPGNGPYTGTIVPPVAALEGLTRIRVRITYTGTLDPCGATTYGEVEDYTINVLPAGAEGACCTGMDCTAPVTEVDCLAAGGVYMGNGSNCAPNPCVGACCFTDGSCEETLDEAACVGLGGAFSGVGTTCTPNACPQPGTDCLAPIAVELSWNALPYVDDNTTCGHLNDYTTTCLGYYDGGEDIIYELTLNEDMSLWISVDGALTYLGMAIDTVCPPGPACLAYNTSSSGNPSIPYVWLTAGTYYLMIDTWPAPSCSDYTLTIFYTGFFHPNDECVNAEVVTDGTPAVSGENCLSTDDGTASCQSNSHHDLWYRYTATCVGTVVMDTEGSMQSDTVLSVYDACGGNELACDDDGGTGLWSRLSVDLVTGQEVWIRVASYSTGCGEFNLNIVCNAWPQGACCQPDGSCVVTYEPDCTAADGTYAGDNTTCAGDDCNLNGHDDLCDILSGAAHDCNENGVPDECDIESGVSEDCQLDGIPDECQLGGDEVILQYDDGTHENTIGLNSGGAIAWMNHFVIDGGMDIIAISVAWGDVPDGTYCEVMLWSDPNQDDDPTDAQVIASAPTVVANADTDILSTVTIPAANVGPAGTGFFAGAYIEHAAGQHPASVDSDGPLRGQSWIAGDTTYNLDPNNLGAADVPPVNIDTLPGLEGNWLIRATGLTASNDCNANGRLDECDIWCGYSLDCNYNMIPDECDIAGGDSQDCNGNSVPDECDLYYGTSRDCNYNARPDECDIGVEWGGYCIGPDCEPDLNYNGIPDSCDDCGDLDADADVDMDDYWVILAAFGTCAGDLNYVVEADADDDHCITLYDFWYWRICYMFANGRDFGPPAPGVAGDLNCDGAVDFADINPFVLYLTDFAGWQVTYPGCPAVNGDVNSDGQYPSFTDINAFTMLLSGRR